MRNYALTEQQQAAAAEMYNNGVTPLEIANKFGVSTSTVQKIRRRFGIEPQNKELSEFGKIGSKLGGRQRNDTEIVVKRKRLSEDQAQLVSKLYSQGISPSKIADMFGVSVSHVGNVRRRFGVPAQNPDISESLKTYHESKRNSTHIDIDSVPECNEEEIKCVIDKEAALIRFLKTVNSEIDFLIKVLTDEIN